MIQNVEQIIKVYSKEARKQ